MSLQCGKCGTGKVGRCHLCSDSTFRDSVDSFWSTLGGQRAFICRPKRRQSEDLLRALSIESLLINVYRMVVDVPLCCFKAE